MGEISPRTIFLTRGRGGGIADADERNRREWRRELDPAKPFVPAWRPVPAIYQTGRGICIGRNVNDRRRGAIDSSFPLIPLKIIVHSIGRDTQDLPVTAQAITIKPSQRRIGVDVRQTGWGYGGEPGWRLEEGAAWWERRGKPDQCFKTQNSKPRQRPFVGFHPNDFYVHPQQ